MIGSFAGGAKYCVRRLDAWKASSECLLFEDYDEEAYSLGSPLWGACCGSASSPCRPPVSSYSIVFGAIAPFQ